MPKIDYKMIEIKPLSIGNGDGKYGCMLECPFLIENKYTDKYHFQCGYCDMKPVTKGAMCR